MKKTFLFLSFNCNRELKSKQESYFTQKQLNRYLDEELNSKKIKRKLQNDL
jgi:hypothetical protein